LTQSDDNRPSLRPSAAPLTALQQAGALSLGIGLILAAPPPALAQLARFNCLPNTGGDGWVCETTEPDAPINTASGSNQYNSDRAVLPGPAPAQTEPPATVSQTGAQPVPVPDVQPSAEQILPAGAARPEPGPMTESETSNLFDEAVVAPRSQYPLDWMPRDAMTPAQRDTLAPNCCGGFVDPAAELFAGRADPDESETLFRSESGLSQLSQNFISIDGNVIVQQGARTIENNLTTSINRSENTVLMDGDVIFREPGLMLRGSSAFIDSDDQLNRIETAQYVLHDFGAHGTASSVVYSSTSGQVAIENGEFSRCEPGNEFWVLSADSIVLDQENNRGYAKKASIRVRDFPIFYYPFTLPFPLGEARASGLLPPSIGSTRTGGFDYEQPYYLNLAPNYDATISPRLLSDRGVMLGTEFRYLADWSMNTLNLSGLSGDKMFNPDQSGIRLSDSPQTENRWFVGFEHQGTVGRYLSTYVDFNKVSDDDYFYDFGGTGLNVASRNHLNQQGLVNFNSSLLRARLNVQRIQLIDPFINRENIYKPYDRLPQFSFNTDTALPLGFELALKGELTAFDRELDEARLTPGLIERGALVTGERATLEPRLSWSTVSPGWFVRANASYQHTQYQLENQAIGTLENPELGIPVYSLDSGLFFDRKLSQGGLQTLEPRIFYLYSEFEDQSEIPVFDSSELNFSFSQLFREDRFSGGDRTSNADQVTLAVTTRVLNANGEERFRASLGQVLYFEDRLVSLSNPLRNWDHRYAPLADQSAYVGEVAMRLGQRWRFNTDFQWNEDRQEFDEGSLSLRYQGDSNHLLNVAFRYRSLPDSFVFFFPPTIDPRTKQSDVSGVWPLTDRWKLLGRINYDHSNERNLESFAGVEWSDCCATIRVIAREWVDENQLFVPNIEPNRGIFVQFTLNGLGNLGGAGISNLLEDGIRGFRDNNL